MLVLGIVETVHGVVVRWSRWSSQTAGECNTENSCLRSDAPCKKKQKTRKRFICWWQGAVIPTLFHTKAWNGHKNWPLLHFMRSSPWFCLLTRLNYMTKTVRAFYKYIWNSRNKKLLIPCSSGGQLKPSLQPTRFFGSSFENLEDKVSTKSQQRTSLAWIKGKSRK